MVGKKRIYRTINGEDIVSKIIEIDNKAKSIFYKSSNKLENFASQVIDSESKTTGNVIS